MAGEHGRKQKIAKEIKFAYEIFTGAASSLKYFIINYVDGNAFEILSYSNQTKKSVLFRHFLSLLFCWLSVRSRYLTVSRPLVTRIIFRLKLL